MSGDPSRDCLDAYTEREVSPNGELIVEFAIHPQRMSHETRVPRLILAATGETLLSMPDSLYDASASWGEGRTVRLHLRHYDDGSRTLIAEVDWGARTIAIGPEIHPLEDGAREIVRAFKRMKRRGAAATAATPEEAAKPPARPRIRLLPIAFAVLLLAAAALASWWLG